MSSSFESTPATIRKSVTPSMTSPISSTSHSPSAADRTPLRRYFSRRHSLSSQLPDLPAAEDWVGIYSGWALLWGILFLIVPFAYTYIALVVLRELCRNFVVIQDTIQHYVPLMHRLLQLMQYQSSTLVEIWCWIEAVFYIVLKMYIYWLQRMDPLEASLSAAPMMELQQRNLIWRRMMDSEKDDPISFVTGWFFDENIENISQYDVRDFLAWSMFETRHQEHLTSHELEQLEEFLEEMEYRVSLQLYGPRQQQQQEEANGHVAEQEEEEEVGSWMAWKKDLPKPQKTFRFTEESTEDPSYFLDMYDYYKARYEHFRHNASEVLPDFHPVQEFRNLVAGTKQQLAEAEEAAMTTAMQMYEALIPVGSQMDKQLTAMSNATKAQLSEAWSSMKSMKERLEAAHFLSKQQQRIRQQLKGYRAMLNRMRDMSSGVPSRQMAAMMRRITECNQALESLESRAASAFEQASGFARNNMRSLLQPSKQPKHFFKYSSDPMKMIKTYPLGFHMLILGGTEIPLRIMMRHRGFERRIIGSVAYYMHPGRSADQNREEKTPLIFVHGIGIGLIVYIPLIDKLLATGRPILLPEIPYVSGFRPFQSPHSVLTPATVVSTMSAMLATYGYMRGTWIGHSYGTSWVSYMVQFGSVAAVMFLDPICFCLHIPALTRQFVYMRPDPGSVSYMLRTDAFVNFTIQRSFPWSWIALFVEQINVPCSIFLSEKDALVPTTKVTEYLKRKQVPFLDFDHVTTDHLRCGANASSDDNNNNNSNNDSSSPIVCTVFRGAGHGDWTEHPASTVPTIALAAELVTRRAEELQQQQQSSG